MQTAPGGNFRGRFVSATLVVSAALQWSGVRKPGAAHT
jgi:hypothetical protein